MNRDLFCIGTEPDDPSRLVFLPTRAKKRHLLCTGASGAGKSMFLVDQVMQDWVGGRGAIVLEPKGDLVTDIVSGIAMMPEAHWLSSAEELVIIDPADPACPARFNPFEVTPYGDPSRQRQDAYSALRRPLHFDERQTPRGALVFRKATQLAIENGLTICDLPNILADADFAKRLASQSADEDLRRFWLQEFPSGRQHQLEWVSSTLVRLETLLDHNAIRRFLGAPKSTFSFREIMDSGKTCLISLAKGALGQESARLLGGLLLGRLQLDAESRVQLPNESRRTCHIYLDEAQNYATTSLEELIAEGRGMGAALTVSHQHLSQLGEELRHALLSNANIRVAFRLATDDASLMAREFHMVTGDRVKERRVAFSSLGPLPIPHYEYDFFSTSDESRQNRDALHYLPDRHMLVHLAGEHAPYMLRSVDVPVAQLSRERERSERFKRFVYDHQRGHSSTPRTVIPVRETNGAHHFEWGGAFDGQRTALNARDRG